MFHVLKNFMIYIVEDLMLPISIMYVLNQIPCVKELNKKCQDYVYVKVEYQGTMWK